MQAMIYQITRRHTPQASDLQSHRHVYLESNIFSLFWKHINELIFIDYLREKVPACRPIGVRGRGARLAHSQALRNLYISEACTSYQIRCGNTASPVTIPEVAFSNERTKWR
jgi:hypothetical protein